MLKICALGTGAGVRFSKELLKQTGMFVGQEVEIIPQNEGIFVRPARPKFEISELVRKMKPENRPESMEFGISGSEKI